MVRSREHAPPLKIPGWKVEVRDPPRGMSGGFLFGIPLVYTMAVGWRGSTIEPPVALAVLAATYTIVVSLDRTDGFRQDHPGSLRDRAKDGVEALASGRVSSATISILPREIAADTPLEKALGKMILENIPFSLGVAPARSPRRLSLCRSPLPTRSPCIVAPIAASPRTVLRPFPRAPSSFPSIPDKGS